MVAGPAAPAAAVRPGVDTLAVDASRYGQHRMAALRITNGGDAVTTFRQLLEFFEQSAKTQAAKGKRFEDFCEAFLRIDPLWSERFDAVWAWQDWPNRP